MYGEKAVEQEQRMSEQHGRTSATVKVLSQIESVVARALIGTNCVFARLLAPSAVVVTLVDVYRKVCRNARSRVSFPPGERTENARRLRLSENSRGGGVCAQVRSAWVSEYVS